MKIILNTVIITAVVFSINCGNDNPNVRLNNSAISDADEQASEIIGEWTRIGAGHDENNNGTLDESETKTAKNMLAGSDYFHFYESGKCVFDSDIKFDGEFKIKEEKGKKFIYIYGSGMPAGLSEKERDKAAYVYRIHSVNGNKMILAPAHLMGTLVLYKRK